MANLQDIAIRILIRRDGLDKDLAKVERSLDKAWQGIKVAAAAAGVAAGAALASGLNGALDKVAAQGKLAASLGDASFAEKAGRIAGGLYADGWGRSMGDVVAAAGAVGSSIESIRSATDEALSDATRKALAFASAFDVDVAEGARNAGILIANGLAKDADEAFDLLTASLQRVPQALRGEVMDATQEYSQFFAQLGFDGAQSLGLIGSAARDAGQYGIDKMGDAIKEFNIRATDMSALTRGAFATIGLDAQAMAADLLAGGDTAQAAFQKIVGGLRNIGDPVLQSNTAIALFGTQLEDLGTGNIPDFLASLDPATSTLGDVAGAADEMAGSLTVSPLEEFKREVQAALVDKMEAAIPHLRDAAQWLKENKAVVEPLVAVLGSFALVIGTIIAATKVWAIVQTALNIVMAANPIGLVVLAVLALIGIGILLWQNWDTVKEKLGAAWDWLVEKFNWAVDKVKEFGGKALDWFKELPGKIKDALSTIGDKISAPFKAGFEAVKRFWNNNIGGKGFDLPSWVPGVGGKSFRFPTFHSGGIVQGTGDQIIRAQGGEGVFTREQMRAMGSGDGGKPVELTFRSSGRRIEDLFMEVFAAGVQARGGVVQTVAGR